MSTPTEQQNDKEITIARTFDAPRALVWKYWTETTLIEKWFGPQGFNTRVEKNDLKQGGRLRYVMIGPDGKEYPSEGTILELKEGEKIVSTDEFGEDFDAGGADLPSGMITTTLFEDENGKTKVTIRISHPTIEDKMKHEKMGVIDGYNSQLDKLVELLKNEGN